MFWLKKLKRIFNRATWIHIFYFHVPSPWASELLHLIRFPVFRNMHSIICLQWSQNVWVDGKVKRTHPVIVAQSLILKFCYIGNAVAINTSNCVLLGFSFHFLLLVVKLPLHFFAVLRLWPSHLAKKLMYLFKRFLHMVRIHLFLSAWKS